MSEDTSERITVREDLLPLLLPVLINQGWVVTRIEYNYLTLPSTAFVELTKEKT
ncbi:MAG: hypothetical protein V2A79_09130 [Planctomycetota bacterium]